MNDIMNICGECERCGEIKDVEYKVNCYEFEVYGEENEMWLCDDCDDELYLSI